MGAATTRPPDLGPGPDRVSRFDRAERNLHWCTAALVGACLLTAAALYLPAAATLVGRRALVRDVHVYSGLALPVPFLVARLGPWRARLRRDVASLARFEGEDWRWLRSLGRDPWARPGKFNAGQKVNAAFVVGAGLLLLATGSMMRWFSPFPLAWRTGATFVHDWVAFLLLVALVGHVVKAVGDREALRGMVGGTVDRRWAERRCPAWAPVAGPPAAGDGAGETGTGGAPPPGPALIEMGRWPPL